MEKIADRIESLLQQKLALYQELQSILEEEKNHVVSMDVSSLWVTISKKKSLILRIEYIRQNIISLLGDTYSNLNTSFGSFDLLSTVKLLTVSPEKKGELKRTVFSINTCKKEITLRASENKNFINEHLTIIDGIFSTLWDGKDKNGYNPSGSVLKNGGKQRLIHAEV